MNKFYIRYHIKGGNRVLAREVSGYEIEEVMSEVIYDLDNKKRILFSPNKEKIYGISVDSVSFFEVLTEKEFKLLQHMDSISNALKGAFK